MTGGDKIDEMNVDFWQLNLFELPHFQGEKATLEAVKNQMQKWIKPFETLMDSFYKECERSIDKGIADTVGLDDIPAKLLEFIKSLWLSDASKAVKEMKQRLIPPSVKALWLGESELEKMMIKPPKLVMDAAEMDAYLSPDHTKFFEMSSEASKEKLAAQCQKLTGEVFDYQSGEEPPLLIKMLIVVRKRILDSAKTWVGTGTPYGEATGQMNGFMEKVQEDIKQTCRTFEKFERKIAQEQTCLDFLKEDQHGVERNRLLKQQKLLQHAMYEADKL